MSDDPTDASSANERLVTTAQSGGVFRITLNRPAKRNALSRALLRQLSDAVAECARSSARVVVLSATGPAFCAGMDLAEMQATAARPDARELWERDTVVYRELLQSLHALPMPTIAVVQGPVLAGGVGLVAACDLVVAAETATVALPEPKRGITAAVVLPLLMLKVGPSASGWLLLSGESWTAAAARSAGLFHDVTPPDRLDERVASLTNSVLSGSPQALAVTKAHWRACAAAALDAQLDEGMRFSARARETDEAREGLDAFLAKRPPSWTPQP